jgi:uncharacterized protein YaiL (DUF2058 family)
MANSLQEQLLKAGLANAKQAKKAKAGKAPKKSKKQRGQDAGLSEGARAARQAMAEKAARDRELNLQHKREAEARALQAQVRQLIEQHRLARDDAELDYHFVDGSKVRRLLVSRTILDQLASGKADVVRLDGHFEVVPAAIADKIRERQPDSVMARNRGGSEPTEDDPYQAYPVPDDLMW